MPLALRADQLTETELVAFGYGEGVSVLIRLDTDKPWKSDQLDGVGAIYRPQVTWFDHLLDPPPWLSASLPAGLGLALDHEAVTLPDPCAPLAQLAAFRDLALSRSDPRHAMALARLTRCSPLAPGAFVSRMTTAHHHVSHGPVATCCGVSDPLTQVGLLAVGLAYAGQRLLLRA